MAKKSNGKKPTKYIVTDGELTLVLEEAEEGGFTVTCPYDSALITEADTLQEAFEMARDAAAALKESREMLAKVNRVRRA